jgi:hypothetical protein
MAGGLSIGRTTIEVASLLWLNMWRRMVMSDVPFTAALSNKHREAARTGYRLALTHSGKLIKPGEYYSVLTDHDCVPFAHCVLVATPL